MKMKAPELVECLRECAASWRIGDDLEALGKLQLGCLLIFDKLEGEACRGEEVLSADARLADESERLAEALERGDVIRACDVLEYRILPLLEEDERLRDEARDDAG